LFYGGAGSQSGSTKTRNPSSLTTIPIMSEGKDEELADIEKALKALAVEEGDESSSAEGTDSPLLEQKKMTGRKRR
jgi:hypothetical protein